ncbi:hypothetical protein MBANPS3_012514 [Mucor bainieri]
MTDTRYFIEHEDIQKGFCDICENSVEAPLGSIILVNELNVMIERGSRVVRRHWTCINNKLLKKRKTYFGDETCLDGFPGMSEENFNRLKKAWKDGQVDSDRSTDVAVNKEERSRDDDFNTAMKLIQEMMSGYETVPRL